MKDEFLFNSVDLKYKVCDNVWNPIWYSTSKSMEYSLCSFIEGNLKNLIRASVKDSMGTSVNSKVNEYEFTR